MNNKHLSKQLTEINETAFRNTLQQQSNGSGDYVLNTGLLTFIVNQNHHIVAVIKRPNHLASIAQYFLPTHSAVCLPRHLQAKQQLMRLGTAINQSLSLLNRMTSSLMLSSLNRGGKDVIDHPAAANKTANSLAQWHTLKLT